MHSHPVLELEATAFNKAQLIHPDAVQLALVGRSNVGKSSLVNALAGRKAMAKVSATPGKTRSVNYYRANPGDFYIVDLPGYGYAKCSKAEQEKWAAFLQYYLANTAGLRSMILLIDARLTPQKPDLALVSFARSVKLPILPVLTKADKCGKSEISARKKEWEAIVAGTPLIITSSSKRQGMAELWDAILQLVEG